MPRLYLLVRTSSTDPTKPSPTTYSVPLDTIPTTLSANPGLKFATFTIISPSSTSTYRVAVSIPSKPDTADAVHISFGSTERAETLDQLRQLPESVRESDKERRRGDHVLSAEVRWEGKGRTCLRVGLREDKWLWFEMIEMDVSEEDEEEEDAVVEKGGDKKRRKK